MEKKSQKVRWRYFIDKPFQIRFIVRFFILVLIGLGLSLGTILLLDNYKFMLGTLHFRAKNIDQIESVVSAIKNMEASLFLLRQPDEMKKTIAEIESYEASLKDIIKNQYQLSPESLSKLYDETVRVMSLINSNTLNNGSSAIFILDSIEMLGFATNSDYPAYFSNIMAEVDVIKHNVNPMLEIGGIWEALNVAPVRDDISAATNIKTNPLDAIKASIAKIDKANGAIDMAVLDEIQKNLDILKELPYVQDAYNTKKRLSESNNAEEIFALTIEKKGLNSFELYFMPIVLVSILYLLLIAFFGLFISHKMAGPVYRIKKTLQEAAKGSINIKELEFKLRKKDELQDLVLALNEFLDKLATR